jgi:3-deoxy-D-manno-octulosonic-acid transferase
MYYLYNFLLLLSSPFLLAYLGKRLIAGKSRSGWSERWGNISINLQKKNNLRIWVHAASVGEVMAAQPILSHLKKSCEKCEIILSVITPGGYEVGQQMLGRELASVIYAPFDLPFAVKRTIKTIQPDILLLLETELWPNMIALAHHYGSHIIMANGRISDRSYASYCKMSFLFRWLLTYFDKILTQTELDRERYLAIGAPENATFVSGNAKFDQAPAPLPAEKIIEIKKNLKLSLNAHIVLVGSTRQAEEEKQIFSAFIEARKQIPNLILIHAPRHIDRADEVARLAEEMGLSTVRRTLINTYKSSFDVLILDTFGELASLYAVCDVAIVGNSFLPQSTGQTPLQALAQGKPVIFGPSMVNFRDIAALILQSDAGFQVSSSLELTNKIVELMHKPMLLKEIAIRGTELIQHNRGAAERYSEEILSVAGFHS